MQEKNNSVDLNPTVCQILYDQGKWYLKKAEQDTVFINDQPVLNDDKVEIKGQDKINLNGTDITFNVPAVLIDEAEKNTINNAFEKSIWAKNEQERDVYLNQIDDLLDAKKEKIAQMRQRTVNRESVYDEKRIEKSDNPPKAEGIQNRVIQVSQKRPINETSKSDGNRENQLKIEERQVTVIKPKEKVIQYVLEPVNLSVKPIEITQEHLKIGRSEEMADYVLDQKGISRDHAEFKKTKDGRLFIKDNHSTNGIFVNDKRILDTCELYVGDRVSLYTYVFEVKQI